MSQANPYLWDSKVARLSPWSVESPFCDAGSIEQFLIARGSDRVFEGQVGRGRA